MQISRREQMLRVLAAGMHRSGALRLAQILSHRMEISASWNGRQTLRRPRGPKFAILCYHRVGTGGVPYYSELEPRVFEAQMAFLRRAYRVVTLDQLCHELNDGDPEGTSGDQAVAITFDDGYRDLYTHALPILRKYNLPATVYLTAAAIETGEVSWYDRIFAQVMSSRSETFEFEGPTLRRFTLSSRASRLHAAAEFIRTMRRSYPNQQRIAACAEFERTNEMPSEVLKDRMLTWSQIREMQESGISFGAHTMSHPAVGRLSMNECHEELAQSKKLLEERLQRSVEHFAFPFGLPSDLSPETCSLISSYGYRSAASTVWGINTPRTNRHLLRRIGGEELSVPLLAFYLRWLFLKDQSVSPEMSIIESAMETAQQPTGGAVHEQSLGTGAALA